jgi:hypothetical protein
MEKVLELLRRAMEQARIVSVLTFDPELFLFTSALQIVVRKAEDYVKSKKRKASDMESDLYRGMWMVMQMDKYTRDTYGRRLL